MSSCRSALLSALLLSGSWFGLVAAARAEAGVFRPAAQLTFQDLENAVSAGSPALEASRKEVSLAAADVRQSRLLDNPTVDAQWGTIPVGRTTPPGLERPFANVPNYGVGLGYTVPVKKRGPRKQRADFMQKGAEASLEADAREQALLLADVLGALATSNLRRDGLAELVVTGKRALELADARVRAKFGAPLDVDRLVLEVQRAEQMVAGAEGEITEELAACASLVGMRCENFASADDARAYLARWIDVQMPTDLALDDRPDVRALSAYAEAMRADEKLAEAQRLPDPTVRVGYVHDRFIEAGNQRNSFALSVSMPLPIFDRGQAQKQAAEASRKHYVAEREKRLEVAKARVPVLVSRVHAAKARCERVEKALIPSAENVLDSLESAEQSRLIPLTEVLQARRTLVELYIDQADSCGDAYRAALELLRETPAHGVVK